LTSITKVRGRAILGSSQYKQRPTNRQKIGPMTEQKFTYMTDAFSPPNPVRCSPHRCRGGDTPLRFPRPFGEGGYTRTLRGWERNTERLPPGYRLDTIDAANWVLRRPDGTPASYFSAWSATREAVERAARADRRIRFKKRGSRASPYSSAT
jgi:hypothetical protein